MYASVSRHRARHAGFTLTELAIVMIIMALLIGGMLVPLSTQQDLQANAETTRQLDDIRESLIGYAMVNGHFPCPAVSPTNGNENRDAAGICQDSRGLLPWVTLSTKPSDSWGHLLLYSVSKKFSKAPPAELFAMASKGDISIKTRDDSGTLVALSNIDIPVVILSSGKNGQWAYTRGQAAPTPDSSSPNVDEYANAASNGTYFVSRTPSGPGADGGEFDDLVTWISPHILISRMVAANKLP